MLSLMSTIIDAMYSRAAVAISLACIVAIICYFRSTAKVKRDDGKLLRALSWDT